MNWDVQDVWIVSKNGLSSITVMDVPIDDQNSVAEKIKRGDSIKKKKQIELFCIKLKRNVEMLTA